jgi:ribose-phosphate pyrophosphokinase
MTLEAPQLFVLGPERGFGQAVAKALGQAPAAHEERDFEDGEHKARPLESVRDRDLYVLQTLHSDDRQSANDRLVRLLFFLGAVRDAGAARVTAVLPYLAYARKDRRTKPRDPVSTRYLAQLLEAVGTDRVVTLQVHNLAAYQNAFRCAAEHLDLARLLAEHFAPLARERGTVVVSPDVGGVKRAERMRAVLARTIDAEVGLAFMEKKRSEGVVSGEALVGDVAERLVIVVDDMVATGGTMARCLAACARAGAWRVYAAAAHGLFMGGARELVESPHLERLVVTNTIPPFRLPPETVRRRLEILDAAPLFAEAIRRMHEGGSLVDLLEPSRGDS